MDAQSLIVWLVVGGVAGWLAGMVVKGGGYGLIGDIVVGYSRRLDRWMAAAAGRHSSFATVMTAADKLPVEKRGVFLQRVVASLSLRGTGFNDDELDDAMRRALVGLIQNSTA